MIIKKTAVAGTYESSDLHVTVEPNDSLVINLKTTVDKQYGNQIHDLVSDIINKLDVNNARITIDDKGALDFAIIARLKTALHRAAENTDYNWE